MRALFGMADAFRGAKEAPGRATGVPGTPPSPAGEPAAPKPSTSRPCEECGDPRRAQDLAIIRLSIAAVFDVL